ncbi:NADPH:quinone reductase [Paenibacillus montaniterrae]|uniref:Zinc-type alcohol dehydrogenase-like protein n=1 Tax=Paenibacillus montaniterrae TaxID=429341 RepID=A0A920D0V8_9BACL|nr:zinc-binding alcohol dehydrogenase family protein [Paenibacillus montaniterrae]GIP18339.1 NADPH:quinone reductase [Paenibacillus montaniterrae]
MTKQAMMKAIGYYKPKDGVPAFEEVKVERPQASGRDLLVEVKAVSVNPTDWRSHMAKNPEDSSLTIAGRDVAGVVVATGPDCNLFKVGDQVYYSGSNIRPGGFSEFHLVDERIVGRKPQTLNYAEAAALPLTTITAWEGLYDRLGISNNPSDNKGKSILIIGAAGGVGSIATQLAKLAGLQVIATASRPESIEWTKENGADHVIDHRQPLEPQLKKLGLHGVNYIFVLNSPDQHLDEMKKVILPQGKICSILPFEQPVDLGAFFAKSVTYVWELMFTRSLFQTDDMIEQHRLLNEVSHLVDSGKIRTTLKERLAPINPDNMKEAFRKSLSGSMLGKIVLEGFEE